MSIYAGAMQERAAWRHRSIYQYVFYYTVTLHAYCQLGYCDASDRSNHPLFLWTSKKHSVLQVGLCSNTGYFLTFASLYLVFTQKNGCVRM